MAVSNLEILLKLIAQAAPGSWYPRLQAESRGVPLEAIYYYLEQLHLDGLITRGIGDESTGPGVTLTPKGERVLQDPAALERLRQGLAIDPGDRGGIVREIFRRPFQPIVTWTLIAINVAVFAYGWLLASHTHLGGVFLGGFLNSKLPGWAERQLPEIWHQNGSVKVDDLLRGQWWRLLTACFVHFGLIHIGLNMWVLRGLGRYAEQMWGRARYLVIYLLSGLGGTCLAMIFPSAVEVGGKLQGVPMAGASGAICGLIGAEAVWIWLNSKYLPRSFLSRWRRTFVFNAALLLFISVAPGVSGMGHLGGILVGAAAAAALNWQRFGPSPWRWFGLVAVALLPLLGYGGIEYARRHNPIWLKLQPLFPPSHPHERP